MQIYARGEAKPHGQIRFWYISVSLQCVFGHREQLALVQVRAMILQIRVLKSFSILPALNSNTVMSDPGGPRPLNAVSTQNLCRRRVVFRPTPCARRGTHPGAQIIARST